MRRAPTVAAASMATPVSASSPTNPQPAQVAGPARPRILYLGGLGRSGSTLIERLLGELPGVCAVGEVVHMWRRGVVEGERCGCGEPARRPSAAGTGWM